MRAEVRDSQALEALRPLEIVSYLRATGWSQQRVEPDRYAVWTRAESGQDYELVIPLTRWRDFGLRMSEVLTTLESAEHRSQLEILNDLSLANADVVRISAKSTEAVDGTIPLEEAVSLVQEARDAVLAAACSAIQPRAYFAPRKFGQALEYVKRAKMGQTERGSYTVTVISKVAPTLQQPELQPVEIDEPYERRVIKTLGTGLTSIRTAAALAAASGSLDAFKEGVPQGVSANLCDAVVGMSWDRESVRELEFSFSWSRTRPQRESGVLSRISIGSDSLPVIEEAGRLLREISPREEFELEGIVVRLDRQPAEQVGQVTVLGFIEGRPYHIRVELGTEDYTRAVLSHDQRRPIFAIGDLVKEGRSYVLQHPRGVRVLSSEQNELT
jgi:hypothetical protein